MAGVYLQECLPNITGRAGGDEFPRSAGMFAEGAFYYAGDNWDTIAGAGHASAIIGFDASRLYSGKMYRNNCNAVRVQSYGVYMWVRIS